MEDHCNAILSVMQKGKSGESYNISSGNEIDNLTVIKKILEIMNKNSDLIEFVEDRPGHDFRYSMRSDKIRKEMEWKPKVNFEEGLIHTVKWYYKNSEWWKLISETAHDSTPWKK